MKKWKFNLEPVRDHRHMLEERAALQVSAALRKFSEAVEAVRQIRSEILLSTTFFPRENATPIMLHQLSEFQRSLEHKLADAIAREKASQKILEQARAAWNRTRVEKEAIDNLFEKRKAEHQFAILAEEQKMLDSFARPREEAAIL